MAIEAERVRRGIRLRPFLAAAGLSERGWFKLRAGARPRAATLRRLRAALRGPAPALPPSPEAIAALWRLAVCELARARGLCPDAVLASDPSVQRPMDPAWLAAARIRRLAFWVVVTGVGISMSALGRATGFAKQNISKALREVEDARDDAATAALLDAVTRRLGGAT